MAAAKILERIPAINPRDLKVYVTPKRICLAAGICGGLVIIGLIRYFRRKKRSSTPHANGSLHVPVQKARSQSPAVATSSNERPTTITKRKKTSVSVSSTISATNLQNDALSRQTVSFKQDVLVVQGMENMLDAIRLWERAVSAGEIPVENVANDKELLEALEKLLDKAYQLRDDTNILLKKFCPEASDNFSIASGGYGTPMFYGEFPTSVKRPLSVLSDDSFVSAVEELLPSIMDLEIPFNEPLTLRSHELILFQEGLREVNLLNVPCRVLRTEFLKCKSDDEFLAKLFGVRLAFTKLLTDSEKRDWIAVMGRSLLSDLLTKANKDCGGFQKAYDELLAFALEEENWTKIQEELRGRKLVEFSFYDVVLDFIFMDAFDDLAHPPASVIAVAQNRFLSSSFKESTLSAVVWSVIKAKRTRLMFSDGFIAHFYSISEQVSPIMAWGFLGTDEMLKDLFNYFKSQLCNLLIDIFNFERVRYTNVDELSQDIWRICETRAKMTSQKLNDVEEDYSPN